MSDLVVGRCADDSRHVVFRVARTPRGIEMLLAADVTPAGRDRLRRLSARASELLGREPRGPVGRVKWMTYPWEEVIESGHPLGPVCRCQALMEFEPDDVAPLVAAALADGRVRTMRVAFA